MGRGPSKRWKELAEHTQKMLPYVRAAIDAGADVELPMTEVAENDAINFRQGLFNAARLLGWSLHCHAGRQKDGTFTLVYAVHHKTAGRAYVMAKHGEDPSKWPYDPRRRSPRGPDGARTDR